MTLPPGPWPATVAGAPPLDPSPEEGRSWLRRELLQPEYRDSDLVQRVWDWLGRLLDAASGAAASTPPLAVLATMLIALALLVAAAWLLSRAARGGRRRTASAGAVLLPHLTSGDLRARAEEALAEDRHGEALVDAFRATATRQAERGQLNELPGRTAHEVAAVLAADHPAHAGQVVEVARLFDRVLYGHRPVDREQAVSALALDDALAGRRTRAGG